MSFVFKSRCFLGIFESLVYLILSIVPYRRCALHINERHLSHASKLGAFLASLAFAFFVFENLYKKTASINSTKSSKIRGWNNERKSHSLSRKIDGISMGSSLLSTFMISTLSSSPKENNIDAKSSSSFRNILRFTVSSHPFQVWLLSCQDFYHQFLIYYR